MSNRFVVRFGLAELVAAKNPNKYIYSVASYKFLCTATLALNLKLDVDVPGDPSINTDPFSAGCAQHRKQDPTVQPWFNDGPHGPSLNQG